MYIYSLRLTAILIYWCQADALEIRNSSENPWANQPQQASQTRKDDLEFWTRHPTSDFRRLQFFRNNSRVRVYYPFGKRSNTDTTNLVSSRTPQKIRNRVSLYEDHYFRPIEKERNSEEHENMKWENQTFIMKNIHRDTESHSKISDDNTTHHNIPRMHKFIRPALLDNLHKTLSKLDEIMRKPHFRRIAEDTSKKKSLRDGPDLSTEESIYRKKATSGSTTVSKWPKVLNMKYNLEDETSRNPKGIDKAVARKFEDCDDESTNYPLSLKGKESKKTPLLGKVNPGAGQETTTKKSPLGPTLSPYSIKKHLEEIASQFKQANISVVVIGRTVSYNDIVLLKVTEKKTSKDKLFRAEDKFLDESPEKKIIFIVHGLSVMGIHLLPCMLQKDSLKKLLSYYFAHLDKFDIFLIPMANPDGVTAAAVDAWNKNTSPQSSCSGVCLDRNFDVMWNNSRTTSSCSQQYPGPSPFSEEETRAVREVIHRYSHKIVAYLHLHSATYTADVFKGDAVLYPRGYTEVQYDDDKYIDLRGEIDEAMKNASFQVLTVAVDTLYSWYGKVSGTSVDYASSVYGIPFAMELLMQIYMDDPDVENAEEAESAVALREVWRRVIDAIFHTVHKYMHISGD